MQWQRNWNESIFLFSRWREISVYRQILHHIWNKMSDWRLDKITISYEISSSEKDTIRLCDWHTEISTWNTNRIKLFFASIILYLSCVCIFLVILLCVAWARVNSVLFSTDSKATQFNELKWLFSRTPIVFRLELRDVQNTTDLMTNRIRQTDPCPIQGYALFALHFLGS